VTEHLTQGIKRTATLPLISKLARWTQAEAAPSSAAAVALDGGRKRWQTLILT
jgi:hypothetical protein